jgi:SAM-dependent methyltransferase
MLQVMNWEECYIIGTTPWDKAAPAPELAHVLSEGMLQGRVFVPGCGRGHDVRAIAGAGAQEVLGLDLAPSAVRAAMEAGVPANATFIEGDLFATPTAFTGRFDWAWEHTCFCAIPPEQRRNYVAALRTALSPGGKLLALFFMDPDMDTPLDGPPFGTSKAELDDLFSDSFTLEREWLPRAAYPGREGRELVRLLRRH